MPIFRRRPLPPRWRPGRRPPPARRRALLHLQQAHRLMEAGEYDQAATIFGELADEASIHGIPRAPQLNLQAGRAWIMAGDRSRGMQRLRRGLLLMGQMGQSHRLPVVGRRVIGELRARGLEKEAGELKAELVATVPGIDMSAPPSAQADDSPEEPRRLLPAKCPHCGGSVHPDSVEWFDDATAACDYCSSVLQTQAR